MRHKVFIRGGHYKTSLGPNGGEATGPILLSRDPQVQLEAATKQYADNKTTNIDASAYTLGTIAVERLPAFTGDITKSEGSAVINITSIGVSAGSYTKATVNQKGQVTAGTVLIESDIPNLDWSKITTDKPTTLAGYGITDALARTNPVMTGALKVNGTFTTDEQLVNKEFVDTTLTPRNLVGDIDFKLVSTTPAKYLRCNGGLVSKTTYPELYAVVGEQYTARHTPGNGRPWAHQFDINYTQDNEELDAWFEVGTKLPVPCAWADVVLTRDRVLLLGTLNNTITPDHVYFELSNKIYSASISSAGTLGAFSEVGTLPNTVGIATHFTTKNKLYRCGGGHDYVNYTNKVYYCDINADGTLGSWSMGPDLPYNITHCKPVVTKDRVYLIGGSREGTDSLISDQVFTAAIDANGVVGSWSEVTPTPRGFIGHSAFTTRNRVYLIGGYSQSGTSVGLNDENNYHGEVYTAPIDADGFIGVWSKVADLPVKNYTGAAYVTKYRVYIIGNLNHLGVATGDLITAPIREDGTLGTWKVYPGMAPAVSGGSVVAAPNYLYYFGGGNNPPETPTTPFASDKIYRVPTLANTRDYTKYYDGSWMVTNSDNFRLPTVTPPYSNAYAYIRYQQ